MHGGRETYHLVNLRVVDVSSSEAPLAGNLVAGAQAGPLGSISHCEGVFHANAIRAHCAMPEFSGYTFDTSNLRRVACS
jgi:hypothetical protein